MDFVLTRLEIVKGQSPRSAVLDRTVIKPILKVGLVQFHVASGGPRDKFYPIRLDLNYSAVVLCVIFLIDEAGLQKGTHPALANQRRPVRQILRR